MYYRFCPGDQILNVGLKRRRRNKEKWRKLDYRELFRFAKTALIIQFVSLAVLLFAAPSETYSSWNKQIIISIDLYICDPIEFRVDIKTDAEVSEDDFVNKVEMHQPLILIYVRRDWVRGGILNTIVIKIGVNANWRICKPKIHSANQNISWVILGYGFT